MKLFKTTVLVNGVVSWGIAPGRIPNLKFGLSKPWSGLKAEKKIEENKPVIAENKPVIAEENDESKAVSNDKWYSLNDGVMGGESSGSAKWYSLNDGVMGGVSTGSGLSKISFAVNFFLKYTMVQFKPLKAFTYFI